MANPVRDKSYVLALEVVRLYKDLVLQKEYVLSRQILKSGTSIGANIHEALEAQSRADFIAKLSIAHKEASETQYWLQLLVESGFLTVSAAAPSKSLLREVIALLTAILKKAKKNAVES